GKQLPGVDLADVARCGRELVEEQPLTTTELGRRLARWWQEHDPSLLTNVVRAALPLVQLPPRGVWGKGGQTTVTTARVWLGKPLADPAPPDDLVLRYLRAFGPASVADVQKWSGLIGLREVVERLRPRLRVYQSESGTALYDLPDAPRPDPGTR